MGDCFFTVETGNVKEILNKNLQEYQATKEYLTKEVAVHRAEMDSLKSLLYDKFGKSIYLEDD